MATKKNTKATETVENPKRTALWALARAVKFYVDHNRQARAEAAADFNKTAAQYGVAYAVEHRSRAVAEADVIPQKLWDDLGLALESFQDTDEPQWDALSSVEHAADELETWYDSTLKRFLSWPNAQFTSSNEFAVAMARSQEKAIRDLFDSTRTVVQHVREAAAEYRRAYSTEEAN